MDEFLNAPVPRNLRVRASVQLGGTRLPARVFVMLMALFLIGAVAIARGAALAETAQVLGLIAALGGAALEGRWWGYSTAQLARVAATHIGRRGTLEL
jgi:hypothetical protein